MSEAAQAIVNRPEAKPAEPVQNRILELKVSGHLMTLDAGVFCIFQPPGSPHAGPSGLPGVRISLPPNPPQHPDSVTISTFREDGWLNGGDGAALVRVADGPAQVLVTVYQAPGAPAEAAPRLQVLRLGPEPGQMPAPPPRPNGLAEQMLKDAEIVAHVQRTGDVGAVLGEWTGVQGSRLWIEGFGLNPRSEITAEQIEYQAVLGRGWLSPWIEGGRFCGSRGMALPLLGLRVRLKNGAAETHEVTVSATFVDGSAAGPVGADEACEAESLAALEAFQLSVRPKSDGGASGPVRKKSEPAQAETSQKKTARRPR